MTITYSINKNDDTDLAEWIITHTLSSLQMLYSINTTVNDDDTVTITVETLSRPSGDLDHTS